MVTLGDSCGAFSDSSDYGTDFLGSSADNFIITQSNSLSDSVLVDSKTYHITAASVALSSSLSAIPVLLSTYSETYHHTVVSTALSFSLSATPVLLSMHSETYHLTTISTDLSSSLSATNVIGGGFV